MSSPCLRGHPARYPFSTRFHAANVRSTSVSKVTSKRQGRCGRGLKNRGHPSRRRRHGPCRRHHLRRRGRDEGGRGGGGSPLACFFGGGGRAPPPPAGGINPAPTDNPIARIAR